MTKLISIVVGVLLVSAACAGSDDVADTDTDSPAPTATGSDADTNSEPTAAPATSVPDPTVAAAETPASSDDPDGTPVDRQMRWFVSFLNRLGADDAPTADDVASHFTSEFLAQFPAQVLIDSSPQIFASADAPFTIIEATDQEPGLSQAALIESANGLRFTVNISVEAHGSNLIQGLFGSPVIAPDDDATIESLTESLAAIGEKSALGVYEVTTGECQEVEAINGTDSMPLGSGFKLWLLAELAHQIQAGQASWDEVLLVADNLKSSPDGQVFAQPAGTELTLQEHAGLMISISDNSATDHLLARLGREDVESAMTRIGIADPAANTPFLSTGELFQLKFVAAEPNAAEYRQLDPSAQAAVLDELQAATLPWVTNPDALDLINAEGVPIDQPRDLDIEWFASPEDMCRTMTHLAELAATPGLEPVAEILQLNPGTGIDFDRERWPVIRFKGGSEPGVLSGTWWFERNDGKQFVISAMASDTSNPIDEIGALTTFASALGLIS